MSSAKTFSTFAAPPGTAMTRVTNLQRACWAELAIDVFRALVGTDDDQTSIGDLMADLGHYCTLHKLDFVGITADAISCWQAELADPSDERLDAGPEVTILIAGRQSSQRHWRQCRTAAKTEPHRGRKARGDRS